LTAETWSLLIGVELIDLEALWDRVGVSTNEAAVGSADRVDCL